jgi:hypothetical protein
MIKVEYTMLEERGIVAFAFEASKEEDLKTLDMLRAALSDGYKLELGFISSNRLGLHVLGMIEPITKKP